MRLLVKGAGTAGLAMHIADDRGFPLCRNHIKLQDWHIEDRANPSGVICGQCRRISEAQVERRSADRHQERSIKFRSP